MTPAGNVPILWEGSATARWPTRLAVALMSSLAALVILTPVAWPAIFSGLSAFTFLIFRRIDVVVVEAGVQVSYGFGGRPVQRFLIEQIEGARVERMTRRQTKGLGYKGSLRFFRMARAVIRNGDGLHLDLAGGRQFWVSVDGPEGAVEALGHLGIPRA
ncbi:MAG: hypothetical protein NZ600_03140 [Acidimicrobiales bacterium]|nr:hypothetical protein [Acidimicrobiales bacterium]